MNRIPSSESPVKGFEACPDPWAKLHVFYNPKTGQYIPARCKKWTCPQCALVNYYVIDHKVSAGNPERFITLTRAGRSPREIRDNLQKLVQGLRRQGYKFEYAAVVELHLNQEPHLHLMQRGDFIPQEELSQLWETYTAKSYGGQGSSVVHIRAIHPNQNVKGYLLKYIKKSWQANASDPKSWARLQMLYPGLNHLRTSRGWTYSADETPDGWQLLPKALIGASERFYEPSRGIVAVDRGEPTGLETLAVQSRRAKKKKPEKARSAPSRNVTHQVQRNEPAYLLRGVETIEVTHGISWSADLLRRLAGFNEVTNTGRHGPAF